MDFSFRYLLPYSEKFSYGAKFRIFRIKLPRCENLNYENFSVRNFDVKNFDSSTRSTEQFAIGSKRDGLALNPQRSVWILLLDNRAAPALDRESKPMIFSSERGQQLPPL